MISNNTLNNFPPQGGGWEKISRKVSFYMISHEKYVSAVACDHFEKGWCGWFFKVTTQALAYVLNPTSADCLP